ncbi:MAG: VanZ family protein [Bacteroidetes bacterium]|nr:VanZ family protein [Bacteroidota bacterium]MDE2671399.1 VanZ family protein [Bacteroidota bacterium]
MTVFTSVREKRLWGYTLAIVVAIYSTLGLARTLDDELGSYLFSVWVWLYVLGCILVLATVIMQGLEFRPGGREIGVAIGIVAAYLLIIVRMAMPTERSDLVEYGVVAVFVHDALLERASQGQHVPVPSLLAIAIASAIGVIDGGIQWFLPSHVLDPTDMLFNVLVVVMAIMASVALRWTRRRVSHITGH